MKKLFFVLILAGQCSVLAGCAGCDGDSSSTTPADAAVSETSSDGINTSDQSGTCPATPCPDGSICYQGSCVEDLGTCATDDECKNDSYCVDGHCLPYGPSTREQDPECKNDGFKPEALEQPVVHCQWDKAAVWSTPMVVDLDGDKKPEIIFVMGNGHLVALHGDTCEEIFDRGEVIMHWCSHVAVADLTGDKVPEIVGIDNTNHVVVFDNQGHKLTASAEASKSGQSQNICSGAAIANLDGQGPPEIVYGGMALRFTGGVLTTLYNEQVPNGYHGLLGGVADVDLDGKPDIVTGDRILDGQTGADKTPEAVKSFAGGYMAVAQFDPSTPEPEVVLISSTGGPGTIRIFHPVTGEVFFGPYTFGAQYGGPPTVADFDGDLQPEVGVAGLNAYVVFDPECAATPLPAGCSAEGVRWNKVTRDFSSGCTGSSVFDFNGDGQAEVVYRDECWLRVYDGQTGSIYFADDITSGTASENPVIADVDLDGHAELIVPSDVWKNQCVGTVESELGLTHQGPTVGIFVLKDPKNRWMPSRSIWNQHTYHITNINDDGTVPQKEANNWESWNNYRQNVQGMIKDEIPGVDLTARWHKEVDPTTECTTLWILVVDVCNRGLAAAPEGVSGTFYQGAPQSGGTVICAGVTAESIEPKTCTTISCEWSNPPQDAVDLWFVVDEPTGDKEQGDVAECKEQNNAMYLPGVICPGGTIG